MLSKIIENNFCVKLFIFFYFLRRNKLKAITNMHKHAWCEALEREQDDVKQ